LTISYQGDQVTLTVSAVNAGPTITFSSANLAINGTLTINGTGFSTTAKNDIVTFTGGVKGVVTMAMPTQLVVSIPTGLKLGALNVTVKVGGLSSGVPVPVATVVPAVTRSIASLPAASTNTVVIRGAGFSTTRSKDSVNLGGVLFTPTTALPTELILTKVPGLTAGPLTASVTVAGFSSSIVQVATVKPVVSVSTTSLPANPPPTVIIHGFGFSSTPSDEVVTLGGVQYTPATASLTELTLSNVTGLTAGKLTASVTANTISSGPPVRVATVKPVVTNTSSTNNLPATATSVIIDGFGFSCTAKNDVVIFSGIRGIVTVPSPSELTVKLLSGLTAGILEAVVEANGVKSGAFVPVATVTPVVTASEANLSATATELVIKGAGFSTTPGHNTVTFVGGATGVVTAASGTKLIVTKLKGLTAGVLQAFVTSNDESSATVDVATVT
jgi:hypothetical protein